MRETLELYAGYFRAPREVGETIELVGLGERADVRVGKLSGGQQRRLDVGVGLIGDPELLFLDEPTTGFDPSARHQAWDVVAGLRDLGKTIFLTTHYMDEAQRLADRVAIISAGPDRRRGPARRARRPRVAAGDDLLSRSPTAAELPDLGAEVDAVGDGAACRAHLARTSRCRPSTGSPAGRSSAASSSRGSRSAGRPSRTSTSS